MATLVQAHFLYQQGQYSKAVKQCQELLQGEGANDLSTLLLASACHFMLRDLQQSLAYSVRAIEVDPSFAEAYGNAGECACQCAWPPHLCCVAAATS